MPFKLRKRRRDVYLDDENWGKLGVLSDSFEFPPGHSPLIRKAITFYLEEKYKDKKELLEKNFKPWLERDLENKKSRKSKLKKKTKPKR